MKNGGVLRALPLALAAPIAGVLSFDYLFHLNGMKYSTCILVLLTFLVVRMSDTHSGEAAQKDLNRGQLVHMVSFKFKASATAKEIAGVEKAFAGLEQKIPQILSFEWGLNNSPEGLNKDFTHGFVLTFHSAQDRDDYLIHPHHKTFGSLVGPLLEDVFVVDFLNKTP